jgi:DNA repair protein RadC
MKRYTWELVAHDADNHTPQFYTSEEVTAWACTIDAFKGPRESFWVVTVDSRNRLIGYDAMSQGTQNISLVHPREVFHPCPQPPIR